MQLHRHCIILNTKNWAELFRSLDAKGMSMSVWKEYTKGGPFIRETKSIPAKMHMPTLLRFRLDDIFSKEKGKQ